MTEQLLGWIKSNYFPWGIALGILVFLVLMIALVLGRKARSRRAWKRLVQVIDGQIKSERRIRTLTGQYRGHPVIARVPEVAGGVPAPFFIVVPAGPGGQDWEIAYRSEKLLGPETWRAFSKDPALHDWLEGARIPERLQGWPKSTIIRYEARRGSLCLGEDFSAPSAEHFRAQLDVLEAMLEVNREMNGG